MKRKRKRKRNWCVLRNRKEHAWAVPGVKGGQPNGRRVATQGCHSGYVAAGMVTLWRINELIVVWLYFTTVLQWESTWTWNRIQRVPLWWQKSCASTCPLCRSRCSLMNYTIVSWLHSVLYIDILDGFKITLKAHIFIATCAHQPWWILKIGWTIGACYFQRFQWGSKLQQKRFCRCFTCYTRTLLVSFSQMAMYVRSFYCIFKYLPDCSSLCSLL